MSDTALRHLWRRLLQEESYSTELMEAPPRYLPAHVLEIGRDVAKAAGLEEIGFRLQPAPMAPAQFAALAEDSRLQGDPKHGEIVFRSFSGACASCHALDQVGARSGPDLSKIGLERSPGELVSPASCSRRLMSRTLIGCSS